MTATEALGVKAVVRVLICGSGNAWKVAAPSDPPPRTREREVTLEIQGDFQNGHHRKMNPTDCFTADTWHESIADAKAMAAELFGLFPDGWILQPSQKPPMSHRAHKAAAPSLWLLPQDRRRYQDRA